MIGPPIVPGESQGTIYNRVFWLSYLANVSLVTANALTFRFAELVAYLGGNETTVGEIVSVGVFAAIAMRFLLGQALDRYGTRKIWLGMSALFIAGCTLFLFCTELSALIFVARVAFAAGIGGMFTCSIVHIQNQVPPHRRTEVIGSLGSSGFVGMVLGAQLGDWFLRILPDGSMKFWALFGTAALLGLIYLIVVLFITHKDDHERPHETPAAHKLLFRYWPGTVVLVALAMGTNLTVLTVFLTRYATHLGLSGIGTFFTGYATFAFFIRVSTRHWSKSMGRHRMILLGLSAQCIGNMMFPYITSEWQFLLPSVACGFGHALLFPAVVSLGAGKFPIQFRGSGTTLVLGFFDLGSALSAPVLGGLIDHFDQVGFTQMFFANAGFVFLIATTYALTAARHTDDDSDHVVIPSKTEHELAPEILQPALAGDSCPRQSA